MQDPQLIKFNATWAGDPRPDEQYNQIVGQRLKRSAAQWKTRADALLPCFFLTFAMALRYFLMLIRGGAGIRLTTFPQR